MDDLEREREEIRNALMQPADLRLEPGGPLNTAEEVHAGDEDVPMPVVAQTVESAGYVAIYDTATRVRSVTNRNMLPAQLKKKLPNGKPRYTTVRPSEPPVQGAVKCMLHKDDPERAAYDRMGFAVCGKSNLVSAHERDIHMRNRHTKEWATIEQMRKEAKEQEDREFQRAWMAALGAKAGGETPRRGRPAREAEPVGVGGET